MEPMFGKTVDDILVSHSLSPLSDTFEDALDFVFSQVWVNWLKQQVEFLEVQIIWNCLKYFRKLNIFGVNCHPELGQSKCLFDEELILDLHLFNSAGDRRMVENFDPIKPVFFLKLKASLYQIF